MKCAIPGKRYGQQRRDAIVAGETNLVCCAEVTKGVGDEAIFVELHATGDVRAVSDNKVCAIVNHRVCDFQDIPTVLPQVLLRTWLYPAVIGTFAPGVHRENDDIRSLREATHHFEDALEVVEVRGSLVWSEGADSNFEAIFLDDGIRLCSQPGVVNPQTLQDFGGVALPGWAKVAAVVIGKGEDIKTRFLQLCRKGFGLAEAVADFGFAALFELAALIQDGSLEVTKGYVCGFDEGCDFPEQLCSRCWQCLCIGVVGTQHDVADGGDGDAGYNSWIGIEYEGNETPEPAGIVSTKKLLERYRGAEYKG